MGVTFEVEDERWSDHPGQRTAFLAGPQRERVAIYVMAGESYQARIAHVAEQVQEWAIEYLWGQRKQAVWPQCPEHPNTHPLSAVVHDGVAVWRCPVSLVVVSPIGSLAGQREPSPGKKNQKR